MKLLAQGIAILLAGTVAGIMPLDAQVGGGRRAGAAGGTAARGRGFTMNIRQMVEGRLQQNVGFTDEEWAVVEPKLWRVATLQLAIGRGPMARITTMLRRFAARGNQGGYGTGATDPLAQLQSQEDPTVAKLSQEFQQESQQLQDLIKDQASNSAQVEAKLAEYRASREKIVEALAAAQIDLRSVLTLRQESLLSLSRFLD